MDSRAELEKQLEQIDERINDAEARLPAHSVKPVLMQRLFELEEERAALLKRLSEFSQPSYGCPSCPQP